MATTATSLRILLLQVVNELQDLRAGQLALAVRIEKSTSVHASSADALEIATRQFRDVYDRLRRQIEDLPI